MSEPSTAAVPPPDNDTGRLDGASRARVFTVIAVIVLFAEVAPLQYTMVSPAARLIGQTGFPNVGSNIAWMTIIFGLVGGASTPILGKLSDLYGKRRMLVAVGIAFLIGSLICATTSSWPLFLVGRGFQAVAIAAATVAYGLIRDLIPRRYVPLAIGLVSTGLGVSGVGGIMLSGLLTDHYSYKSLFWFLVIYQVVMLPVLLAVVPETKFRARQKLDLTGALLLAGGVGGVLVYISNGARPEIGWSSGIYLTFLALGILMLAAFIVVEKRAEQPIINMQLLFSPNVLTVLLIGFFAAMVIGMQAYAIPFMANTPKASFFTGAAQQATTAKLSVFGTPDPSTYHIHIIGDIDYALGFTLLAYAFHVQLWGSTVAMASGATCGELSGRGGARKPLLVAMAAFTVTSAIYVFDHKSWVALALIGVVFGVGFGGYYATTPNLLVEASPPEQQGITAGMLGVVNSLATAIASGLVAAFQGANPAKISVLGQTQLLGTPDPKTGVTKAAEVFTDTAYTQVFVACVVASVVALAVTWFMKSGRTPATGGLGHLQLPHNQKKPETASA